jgi:hypothetical protein
MGFETTLLATFSGVSTTKNDKYKSLKFSVPERYKGQRVNVSDNLNIVIQADEYASKFGWLAVGKQYQLLCDVRPKPPAGNFPAGINWSLLEAKEINK